jgi:hypothetical protein
MEKTPQNGAFFYGRNHRMLAVLYSLLISWMQQQHKQPVPVLLRI